MLILELLQFLQAAAFQVSRLPPPPFLVKPIQSKNDVLLFQKAWWGLDKNMWKQCLALQEKCCVLLRVLQGKVTMQQLAEVNAGTILGSNIQTCVNSSLLVTLTGMLRSLCGRSQFQPKDSDTESKAQSHDDVTSELTKSVMGPVCWAIVAFLNKQCIHEADGKFENLVLNPKAFTALSRPSE